MDIDKSIQEITGQYTQDRYAMYLRKSRADIEMEALGEGETLARHKNMLMVLAEKHDINPDQIDVYHELVSGDSIQERPEMQRLLTNVYSKQYKGVLVVEVERLARGNTKDQGEVADAFQYSNTHIITPSKVYDPNNEFDQEYFEFGLFMSRREYKTIKRRMESGKLQSIQEGNYVGTGRPYGYDIERRSKKERVLIEKPAESKYLKMIFDWFTIDRMSPGQIAKKLTFMHIPTQKGKAEWNRCTIVDILQNPHYIGKVRWNRKQTDKQYNHESGKIKKGIKRNAISDQLIFEGKHDGIISQEQFDLAQSLFDGNVPLGCNKILSNPLAGLIKCADCGKGIRLHKFETRTAVPRYIHRDSYLCKKKSLPEDVVIDALVEALKAYIADFEVKMSSDGNKAELLRHKDMVEAMECELTKLEQKKRRLFDSWEADDGTYTKAEFIERKQMYSAAIEELSERIAEAKKAMPSPVDYKEQIIRIHEVIDCIRNPDLPAKTKNDFLKRYIEVIKYDVVDFGRQKGGKAILDVILK